MTGPCPSCLACQGSLYQAPQLSDQGLCLGPFWPQHHARHFSAISVGQGPGPRSRGGRGKGALGCIDLHPTPCTKIGNLTSCGPVNLRVEARCPPIVNIIKDLRGQVPALCNVMYGHSVGDRGPPCGGLCTGVPAWRPYVQTYSLYLRPPAALRHHQLGGEKARPDTPDERRRPRRPEPRVKRDSRLVPHTPSCPGTRTYTRAATLSTFWHSAGAPS